MLSIVLAALRSRRSSTVALWLLACLVVAGAVGAPFDVFGARARVAAQDVTDAPVDQRLVDMTQHVTLASATGPTHTPGNTDPSAVTDALGGMRSALDLPGAIDVTGLGVIGSLGAPVNTGVEIAYRSGVCDWVVLVGRCPSAVGDVMLSHALATELGVGIGDDVTWPAASVVAPLPKLHVVGLWYAKDVSDPYWGSGLLSATADVGSPTADAMLVARPTIGAYAQVVTVERLLVVTPETIARAAQPDGVRGVDAISEQLGVLATATESAMTVDANFDSLALRIADDTRTVTASVPVLAAELILFGWFALYLVLRAVAAGRRADVGLALLRGTSRPGMWQLFGPQNALPVLAAIPFGAVAGYLGARWLAGPVPADDREIAVVAAATAAAVVALGALAAAAVAERVTRRMSIMEMLRRAPSRRRGWRTEAADAVVVAVAVFALVQAKIGGTVASGAAFGGSVGVAAATPALLGVAVALVTARLLSPAAVRLVPAALRSGSAVRVLSAAHFARRHGLDRVFTLLVIAVALVGNAVLGWHIAADAQHARAVHQLGADRVLQIRNVSAQEVLTATRTADPAGRYAMAAAVYGNVLAVDSSRLATVLNDGPGWPSGVRLAAALDTDLSAPIRFANGPLTLGARATELTTRPLDVAVDLVDDNGTPHVAVFGPLEAARSSYRATVAGCPAGCTFVDLRIIEPANAGQQAGFPVAGAAIVVSSLARDAADTITGAAGSDASPGVTTGVPVGASGPAKIGLDAFRDRVGWRTSIGATTLGPALSTAPDGLSIVVPDGESRGNFALFDPRVFPVDVPLPVPVVSAGVPAGAGRPGLSAVAAFADLTVPARVAARVSVLPEIGTSGSVVDLSAALRLDGGQGAGALGQVWLRGDAPPSVVAKLTGAGLIITSDTTIGAEEAGYQHQAPQVVLRFGLAIAVIAMVAGAIALVTLAAVERGARVAELSALRRNGLATRRVAAVAYASYVWLAAVAIAVGLATVAVAHFLVGRHPTIFADGYAIPPAPHATGVAWLIVIAATALPLGIVAGYAANRLAHAASGRGGGA